MSPPTAPILLAAALGVALLLSDDLSAGGKQGKGNAGLSLDEAVSSLRRGGQGRVLSADTVDRDGQPVHRIKILTDEGRVKRYQLDGESGQAMPRGKAGRER
jgi:uncharacterized membrane protein YkoI